MFGAGDIVHACVDHEILLSKMMHQWPTWMTSLNDLRFCLFMRSNSWDHIDSSEKRRNEFPPFRKNRIDNAKWRFQLVRKQPNWCEFFLAIARMVFINWEISFSINALEAFHVFMLCSVCQWVAHLLLAKSKFDTNYSMMFSWWFHSIVIELAFIVHSTATHSIFDAIKRNNRLAEKQLQHKMIHFASDSSWKIKLKLKVEKTGEKECARMKKQKAKKQ